MDKPKFAVGDVVAEIVDGRKSLVVKRKIDRATKTFVVLNSGVKYKPDGSDLYPARRGRIRTVFYRIERWSSKHEDVLNEQRAMVTAKRLGDLLIGLRQDEALALADDLAAMVASIMGLRNE